MAQHGMLAWLLSFVIFQGIHTIIARKPYVIVIFQGEGPDPLSPLWIHPWKILLSIQNHV